MATNITVDASCVENGPKEDSFLTGAWLEADSGQSQVGFKEDVDLARVSLQNSVLKVDIGKSERR